MGKPWHDGGYSGESIDEWLALGEKYEQASLLFPLEMAIDQKRERDGVKGLTVEELTILAVEALEREVNNGGYSQFFTNSSGEFAPAIVDCLNRIGCPTVAQITSEAIGAIGCSGTSSEDVVTAVEGYCSAIDPDIQARIVRTAGESKVEALPMIVDLGAIEDALNACDQRFYSVGENIVGKLFEYISANRSAILR